MIGLEGISIASSEGKKEGRRSRSVRCGADAADGRHASCRAFVEIVGRQRGECVGEPVNAYGSRREQERLHSDRAGTPNEEISTIGVLISYLEKKYDLTST